MDFFGWCLIGGTLLELTGALWHVVSSAPLQRRRHEFALPGHDLNFWQFSRVECIISNSRVGGYVQKLGCRSWLRSESACGRKARENYFNYCLP